MDPLPPAAAVSGQSHRRRGPLALGRGHRQQRPPVPGHVRGGCVPVQDVAEDVDLADVGTLVGLAGSVTTVTAHALDLPAYQRDRIHGAEVPVDQVVDACTDLLLMTRERRRALPYMHDGRVDVIGAGALIWHDLVARVAEVNGPDLAVVTSEKDILDGIVAGLA